MRGELDYHYVDLQSPLLKIGPEREDDATSGGTALAKPFLSDPFPKGSM